LRLRRASCAIHDPSSSRCSHAATSAARAAAASVPLLPVLERRLALPRLLLALKFSSRMARKRLSRM
jgi:hypothetical protein